ncbi:MAG TPA: hypothetical protein VJ957_01870 [Longimicrobiales bacterium]|nr:hypothetical protein [Longimicrobiales bacterium]
MLFLLPGCRGHALRLKTPAVVQPPVMLMPAPGLPDAQRLVGAKLFNVAFGTFGGVAFLA